MLTNERRAPPEATETAAARNKRGKTIQEWGDTGMRREVAHSPTGRWQRVHTPAKLERKQVRRSAGEAKLDLEEHVASHILAVRGELESSVLHCLREDQRVQVVVDHLRGRKKQVFRIKCVTIEEEKMPTMCTFRLSFRQYIERGTLLSFYSPRRPTPCITGNTTNTETRTGLYMRMEKRIIKPKDASVLSHGTDRVQTRKRKYASHAHTTQSNIKVQQQKRKSQ